MNTTTTDNFDHSRTLSGEGVCLAADGHHECDLDNRHMSRHMCLCGRFFDVTTEDARDA